MSMAMHGAIPLWIGDLLRLSVLSIPRSLYAIGVHIHLHLQASIKITADGINHPREVIRYSIRIKTA